MKSHFDLKKVTKSGYRIGCTNDSEGTSYRAYGFLLMSSNLLHADSAESTAAETASIFMMTVFILPSLI